MRNRFFGAALAVALFATMLAGSMALAQTDYRRISPTARDWLTKCFDVLPPLDSPHEVYQDAETQQFAAEVFEQTNWWRNKKGAKSVKRDPHLDAVAQAHALDMAQQGYFDHDSPQGMDVFDRIETVNCPEWSYSGENLAAGYRTPQRAIESWLDSDSHRKNLLNKSYDYMGVGVYKAPGTEYGWYWVQVFATYRGDTERHTWYEPGRANVTQ